MEKVKDAVKEFFTAYLEKKGYKKTPERFAILDEIYSHQGHLDVEDLCDAMVKRNYRVSRATIYNTMELLLDSNLVIKHQFHHDTAHFERAYNVQKHGHLICLRCGKVEEFTDERIGKVVEEMGEKHQFHEHHHLIYVYGWCKSCKLKMKDSIEKSV